MKEIINTFLPVATDFLLLANIIVMMSWIRKVEKKVKYLEEKLIMNESE